MKMPFIHTIQAAGCNTLGCNMPTSSPVIGSASGITWSKIVQWLGSVLIFLSAISCLIFMLWGGLDMITSGGDKGKFEAGRDRLVFAIIGMIVVASSYAVWVLVMKVVGVNSIDSGIL